MRPGAFAAGGLLVHPIALGYGTLGSRDQARV